MQLAFTERVVPAMQAFDRSLGLVYVADTDKSLTSRRFYKTHATIRYILRKHTNDFWYFADESRKPTYRVVLLKQNQEVQNYCKADLKQRVLFFITIFRLAIPAFFRFTDVTELM